MFSVAEQVTVPAGSFEGVLRTRDYTPLDPDLEEHQFYARGIGPVQVIQTRGGCSREELVSFEPG